MEVYLITIFIFMDSSCMCWLWQWWDKLYVCLRRTKVMRELPLKRCPRLATPHSFHAGKLMGSLLILNRVRPDKGESRRR